MISEESLLIPVRMWITDLAGCREAPEIERLSVLLVGTVAA
jgi:hypothetical protein